MDLRVFSDPRCFEHHVPAGFPECPERLRGVVERLDTAGEIYRPGEHPHRDEAILAVHDAAYVESFERAVERGDGLLGSAADNPLSPGTLTAARGAVDTILHGTDWLMAADGGECFVASRPPRRTRSGDGVLLLQQCRSSSRVSGYQPRPEEGGDTRL